MARRQSAARGPGSPVTARWYAPLAVTSDAAGVLVPVLWVYTFTHQSRPLAAAVVATASWTGVRAVHHRYGQRTLGESRGLLATAHDWLLLLGVLAGLRVLTGENSPVSTALAALAPALLVTGVTGAWIHRHLTGLRHHAEAVRRVLMVGEATAVDGMTAQLAARTDHAYVVIGTIPVGGGELSSGIPELGRLPALSRSLPGQQAPGKARARADGTPGAEGADGATVLAAARCHAADLVLVAPGPGLTGQRLRRLCWAVQDAGLSLTVASGLTDVARRRVRVDTAAGLNLLHIAPPLRRGPQPALKAVLDRTGAFLGLALLAPLLGLLALAVRVSSPGPVIYRQTRIGHRGVPFTLWKFRTMVADAERLRPELERANEHGGGPLFKMRRDPRVTRLGRMLRRTSLDELPQLVNVVRGEMSLVGPRPPLPEEVARYGPTALRRLAVRPGVTGPWQVGGRSDLSWDEGLALDLSYTDNWSVTGDLDLLTQTLRAVVSGRGAY